MNAQQISERLVAIHAAYVERTGKQPRTSPALIVDTGGEVTVGFYGKSFDDYVRITASSLEGALDAAMQAVVSLPSEEKAARAQFHRNLADLIDEGRAIGIDDTFVNPLTAMAQALSEGAITFQQEMQP